MMELGEKICLALLKLKHTEVNKDTCAKFVHANGGGFQLQVVNGQFTCPCPSCFSQRMQQGHSFCLQCGLDGILFACASFT